MKRKRLFIPDELKRFDPKEPGGEETNEVAGEAVTENGAEETAEEQQD